MKSLCPSLVVAGFLAISSANAADPIPWHTDYVAARKEAEEKNRPMVVVIGTQDCFYCRKMETGTFADPNIIAMVNAKFVALKIDAAAHPEFAKAMRVSVYPTTILAGSDGKIHGFLAGYLAADKFRDNAEKAIAAMPAVAPLEVAINPIPIAPIAPIAPPNLLVVKPLPPTARELYALAKEAYHAERYGECLGRCEELLAIHKEEAEAKPALALMRLLQSDPEKLTRAGEQLDERYAASCFALAEAWQSNGKTREAVAIYEKAIKLAPNSKTAEAAQLKLTTLIHENSNPR